MNKTSVVKLTNKVSIVAIFLLLYWVFILTVTSVFGLKVFKENITESFYLSILGILALMAGSLIVNIMLNMTIISESVSNRSKETMETEIKRKRPALFWLFILSFPILALLLFLGDLKTSGTKERHLVKAAKYLVDNNSADLSKIADYNFSGKYIQNTSDLLAILSKQDENFSSMFVIIQDTIDGKKVLLEFGGYCDPEKKYEKTQFLYSCSAQEREYLKEIFEKQGSKHRFSASDGSYKLYYPVKTEKGFIVLYFTDYQRYGKIGS
jgi:uncharacterized membrane protein